MEPQCGLSRIIICAPIPHPTSAPSPTSLKAPRETGESSGKMMARSHLGFWCGLLPPTSLDATQMQ